MGAIDVGAEAINRSANWGGGSTIVAKDNPANADGVITSLEIWAFQELVNCEVAIFYVVSGDNLSTRSTALLDTVASGSKQTITKDSENNDLALQVKVGDYIGLYTTSGDIELDATGGGGIWSLSDDRIPCINVTFGATFTTRIFSLKGIGATAASRGWMSK